MYVVVKDDKLAAEPEPGALRLKNANRRQQQIRSGRRGSVSAERYDPEKDVMLAGSDDASSRIGSARRSGGVCGRETTTATPVHPKTAEQRRRLAEAVRDILLFRSLDLEVMSDVIDAMFERHVTPGEYVIRQGEDGDNFYVIDSGVYDVLIASGSDDDRKYSRVLQFDGRGSFGELALMYNQPRAASVVAVTTGQLWAMDRQSFRRLVLQSAFRKRQMYDRMLRGVPILSALDDYERVTLADALHSMTFRDGEQIVAEGDKRADGMYFIERGAARVTITKNGQETEVARLDAGSYFGEMALLENSARTASVYALAIGLGPDAGSFDRDDFEFQKSATSTTAEAAAAGNEPNLSGAALTGSGYGKLVKVAFLERESFERLLGPCLDVLKRNSASYQKSEP